VRTANLELQTTDLVLRIGGGGGTSFDVME